MRLFDLHCDTAWAIEKYQKDLAKNDLHIDLNRGKKYAPYIQFFGIYTEPEREEEDAYLHAKRVLSCLQENLKQNHMALLQPGFSEQINLKEKKVIPLLSMENASPLAFCESALDEFFAAGLRLLTLTHNGPNAFGEGVMGDPEKGLTDRGIELLKRAEEKEIVIDVSHLTKKGFWDVAKHSEKPFIASHSNSFSICPHARNLTDEQFITIRDCGGLVGLNLHAPFVGEEEQTIDRLIAHIEHWICLSGEDTIALGADFDGTDTLVNGIKNIKDIKKIADRMKVLGYNTNIIEKLFFENSKNFFQKFYKWDE